MTRIFRYGRDPLCVAGCLAYGVNRWAFKPWIHGRFLHGYFNDVWLIPCALPLILWAQRKAGLRTHDAFPSVGEILFHWAIWSLLFEWVGPHWMRHATADPLDAVAYLAGALLAWGYWSLSGKFGRAA